MTRLINYGFTLTELLVVVAIASLITLFAMPSFDNMVSRSQTTAEINRLVGAVNLARHTAVQYRHMATLCGLKPTGKCGASWHGRLALFLDSNQNARFDSGETLVSRVQSFDSGVTAKWRAFQNRQYLQMTPMGYTNYQNGNFVICPSDGDVIFAKQLIINVQGRVRVNHRVNEAGHPVDRKGKSLRC